MIKTGLTYLASMFPARLILFLLPVYFSACGIEEFYYLPQVPQANIHTSFNTEANVKLDPLSEVYASGYSIYYRIYISNHFTTAGGIDIPQSEMSTINSSLNSDFTNFISFTDPTNYSSLPNSNTFRSRTYHELELQNKNINDVLSKRRCEFKLNFLQFAGECPTLILLDSDTQEELESYNLFRNSGNGNNNGINFTPEPDQYFFYSAELVDKTDLNAGINNDVLKRSDSLSGHAYVSMYIVAIGSNPTNFTRLFSKPTHIGVFKLPDVN